jgi:hypothetical protein
MCVVERRVVMSDQGSVIRQGVLLAKLAWRIRTKCRAMLEVIARPHAFDTGGRSASRDARRSALTTQR